MKIISILISATLVSASALGLGLASSASAKSNTSAKALVECGPNGAMSIVDKVPVGCRVLKRPYRT